MQYMHVNNTLSDSHLRRMSKTTTKRSYALLFSDCRVRSLSQYFLLFGVFFCCCCCCYLFASKPYHKNRPPQRTFFLNTLCFSFSFIFLNSYVFEFSFFFRLEFLHIKSKIVLLEYLSATRYSTFDILLPEFHFLLIAVAAYLKKILLFKSNHCLNQTFNLFLLLCSPAFLFDFAKNKKKQNTKAKE